MLSLNPLNFFQPLHQIPEQIFEQLDNRSLKISREVSKSWRNYIDEKKFQLIQMVKIPKVLKNGETLLHLAAKKGDFKMFKDMIENSSPLKIKLNVEGTYDRLALTKKLDWQEVYVTFMLFLNFWS